MEPLSYDEWNDFQDGQRAPGEIIGRRDGIYTTQQIMIRDQHGRFLGTLTARILTTMQQPLDRPCMIGLKDLG